MTSEAAFNYDSPVDSQTFHCSSSDSAAASASAASSDSAAASASENVSQEECDNGNCAEKKDNLGPADYGKKLTRQQRRRAGLLLYSGKRTMEQIMEEYNISRSYAYKLASDISDWVDCGCPDESPLSGLIKNMKEPVYVKRAVISVALAGITSDTKIANTLSAMNIEISPTKVRNILDEMSLKAKEALERLDRLVLSKISEIASDEIFQKNKPIFTIIDLSSLYVIAINPQDDRKADTWQAVFEGLKELGLSPTLSISDACGSLISAALKVWGSIMVQIDIFHALMNLGKEVHKFIRKVEGDIRLEGELEYRIKTKKVYGKTLIKLANVKSGLAKKVELADRLEIDMDTIRELVAYPGYTVDEVISLITFYLNDMKEVAKQIHYTQMEHAIDLFIAGLPNTVKYLNSLFDRMDEVAKEHGMDAELLKKVYTLRRFNPEGVPYHQAYYEILAQTGCTLGEMTFARKCVDEIVENNKRASSLVENLNSKVRPYINIKRRVSTKFTDLLRLYMNTQVTVRSRVASRKGTSPIERLTGQKYDFFELLGLGEKSAA